ncbi:MAG TPA: primosomal protein N' [Streptosporangiaceae bacterium]|nr:primosomal protein N' [Streptosporangiaceae bacterium]
MTQRLVERPRAGRPAARARQAAQVPAASLPVARVAVDVPLPHLDRLFDYLVPEPMSETAVPGCRVKVRFSGRLTAGYLVERAESSEHEGKLAFLHKVVSAEPVLAGEIAGLARAVADRYGGTMADVLRLAIPPRHASAESPPPVPSVPAPAMPAPTMPAPTVPAPTVAAPTVAAPAPASVALPGWQPRAGGPWARYPAGQSYLTALASGRTPRAVWAALPGQDWPHEIAEAAAAARASGRGVLAVVPDARDLELLAAAMSAASGDAAFVSLSAKLGPAERYRRWLAVRRREVRMVIGTRSAMFAPVADLGLVIIWDDGDDLHAEPRCPYPHARDVLLLRAHRSSAAVLIGGFSRTAEAEQLLASGWARPLAAGRQTIRHQAPMIRTAGDDCELERDEAARTARIPSLALRTARAALADGPVLIQVPRRGYLAAVACQRCGLRIRCAACAGPVALAGPGQPLRCGWCGTATQQNCFTCGNAGLRALVTGTRRTAEELGRAFPGVPVRTSSGASVLEAVPADAALVIATPGAEPRAAGGYSAAIFLDAWALLGRPSLRAAEEALRRWMNAAALVRPGAAGGKVVVMADPAVPVVQALIRWDPGSYARRELAERAELRFPPSVRMAALTGPAGAVDDLLAATLLPADAEVLGPVEIPGSGPGQGGPEGEHAVRFLVRAPWSAGTALAVALRAGAAARSARKQAGTVRLELDPAELI